MTNKDKVRSRYPHASAEQESTGEWGVWDISHDERKRLNEAHWPKTFGRGLFGLGKTEAAAWADAVRTIELREGRRLPVPNAKSEPTSAALSRDVGSTDGLGILEAR